MSTASDLEQAAKRWDEFQRTGNLMQYGGMPIGTPSADQYALANWAAENWAEIARLRAELEAARKERDELREWKRQRCRQNPD